MRRAAPLGLAILAMVAGTVLLLANLAGLSFGRSTIKLFPGLTGVTLPQTIPVAPASVLRGQFQAAFAHWVGTASPLFPAAIRLRNQVEYSVFGFSPIPAVLVGPGGGMVERAYAEEYCARDVARWRPAAQIWAAGIRQMQDLQARRGKAFLYVLTPSKVAMYPGLVPPGFTCPSTQADRAGLVPAWLAMLRQAGVHVVDTTAPLRAAAADYPFPLFPAGGTHWNAVGEAVAQQAVLAGLDKELPGRGLAPVPFTWAMRPHPVRDSDDVDLARLMNLFVPAANGPVPVVTPHKGPAPATCDPPRVAIVGGSFSHATLRALRDLSCPVAATEYEYWHTNTLRWSGGALDKTPAVDAPRRDANILAADVVVYEENEQLLEQPLHGQALLTFLRSAAGSDEPNLQEGAAGHGPR